MAGAGQDTHNIGGYERHELAELNTYYKNPRVGDVSAIVASLRANGVYKPIVVNRGTHTGRPLEVLAGNHTLKAHRVLAEDEPDDKRWNLIDCWVVDVDDDRAARIVLADNRTADLGSYDNAELLHLLETVDYDLDGTGYDYEDLDELAALLNSADGDEPTGEDSAPLEPVAEPVTKPGEIWVLGPHKLLIGDATDSEAVKAFIGDELADCVWTDPPYGVDYVGKTKDALTIQNDSSTNLPDLLTGAFNTIVAASKPGAACYVAHADTERIVFETSMREAGLLFRQNLVWVKNIIALGRSDYHYRHEPILYGFTPGGAGRLGRGGDRWYGDDAQSTVFEVDKPSRNSDHPTMKPPELIARMLNNSLRKGGTVLDLFAGSGSTMVAAHLHGSKARLVELDPAYGDVICRRYETITGDLPVRADTGEKISFVGEDK